MADTDCMMGDHETVRVRLRAALCANDPWTALYTLTTDRPDGLAEAVEELYRSDADRAVVRPHLAWLLRGLGESGDEVLLRLFAEPVLAAEDRRDLLKAAVARRLRLPAELLRMYGEQDPASGGSDGRADGPPAPNSSTPSDSPATCPSPRAWAPSWRRPPCAAVPRSRWAASGPASGRLRSPAGCPG
ncbi:hypothetical protein STANM309S_03109 [Streptomyces tanashiensis]